MYSPVGELSTVRSVAYFECHHDSEETQTFEDDGLFDDILCDHEGHAVLHRGLAPTAFLLDLLDGDKGARPVVDVVLLEFGQNELSLHGITNLADPLVVILE